MAEETFTVESAETNNDYTAEYVKAEKSALFLIARAEQNSWALARKLENKKYHPIVIKAVIDHLTSLDLVNDRRFAELWLKARIRTGNKGPRKLLLLLRAKGIDRKIAEAAMAVSLTPEIEAALLRRCLVGYSADNKTAIRFFLKGLGFSTVAIDRYFEE